MLGWLTDILGGGVSDVAQGVGSVIDKFHTSDAEKAAAKLEIEKLLQKDRSELEASLRQELQAKERIIVAELTQGDSYTKRARPTVVYGGLGFIFFNYVLAPLFLPQQASLALPTEFWMAWGGIVTTWSVGRTFEKQGKQNKASMAITGNTDKRSLFD